MKQAHILLTTVLVLFLTVYGNIALKGKEPIVSYLNTFLEITNSSSSNTLGNNVYFYSMPDKRVSEETIVQNTENKNSKVTIEIEGELARKGWLKVNEENFKLKPGEIKNISLSISIPQEATGNYTGRLRIEMK